MDLWESELHRASYAGILLDVVSTEDESDRAVAIRRSPYRDGARVEDLGGLARTTRCQLIFFQRTPEDNHLARFAQLETIKRRGIADTFVHPLTGSYQARITQFNFSAGAEPRDVITVLCTFTEDSDEPAVFDIGAGAPRQSMAEAVDTAAAALFAAVATVKAREPSILVNTAVATDAGIAARVWEADAKIRDVNMQVVGLRDRIHVEMKRLELATQIQRYPILRAFLELEASIRGAASIFTERAPRVAEMTVAAPTNLLAFCAHHFGAAQAMDRYDELCVMNDIRNPARIEAGTVLKAQASAIQPRRLRSPR